MLGFHVTGEGERLKNGFNFDWRHGPTVALCCETRWFLYTLRVRWRIRHRPRLFFNHRFWWRDELERQEKRLALIKSDISDEQLDIELKKLEVSHG